MKKLIVLSVVTTIVITSAFFGVNYLFSGLEDCDPEDYLVGGEGESDGCPLFPLTHCRAMFFVWHYTAALGEEEEIWMHWSPDNVRWQHDMMTFDGEDSLCSRFWCGGPEPKPETSDTWYLYFTCDHDGDDGRDPNYGYYTFTFYNDCTYTWTAP